jgi:hypothetical protein
MPVKPNESLNNTCSGEPESKMINKIEKGGESE